MQLLSLTHVANEQFEEECAQFAFQVSCNWSSQHFLDVKYKFCPIIRLANAYISTKYTFYLHRSPSLRMVVIWWNAFHSFAQTQERCSTDATAAWQKIEEVSVSGFDKIANRKFISNECDYNFGNASKQNICSLFPIGPPSQSSMSCTLTENTVAFSGNPI